VDLDPRDTDQAVTLTNKPALNDLYHWWEIRQADPDSIIAFTDDAPKNFVELLDCINSGAYLFYLALYGADPIGAMWLHDIMRTTYGTPRGGWVGTYVLPEHRGVRTTKAMWEMFYKTLTADGVLHMYIASHHENTRAHAVAERHLGFHRVGIYPKFALCQGQETDFLILSMNEADRAEAWALARARASAALAPKRQDPMSSKGSDFAGLRDHIERSTFSRRHHGADSSH